MSFKTKLMLRDSFANLLMWLLGTTSMLLVFATIKWQKVLTYTDYMYKNLEPTNFDHFRFLLDDYFLVGGVKIIYLLPIALMIDFIVISLIKGSKSTSK